MAIGEATVNLADRGLCLIQGVNDDDSSADSNGAGKSSLVDALCWVLFGTTARGESGDGVINRTAGKGCMVSVTILDGADSYQITRYRKHKTGKNTLTLLAQGGAKNLTKGTTPLTQAEIDRVIGSSYDVFRASIYAGQESFPDLPAMTDKQLKVLVEEAAGVTILEQAYKEANARATDVKDRHGKVLVARDRANQRLADIRADQESAETRKVAYEDERTKAVVDLTAAARAHVDAAKALDPLIAKGDEAGLRAKIAACDAAIAAVDSERTKERTLTTELREAASREAKARSTFENSKTLLTNQITAAKKVDELLGCPCDSCARPLTAEEIKPAKDLKLAGVHKLRPAFDAAKVEAEKAIAAHKASTDALSSFQATMTDVSAKASQRASHERDLATVLDNVRKRADCASRAKDAAERIKDVKSRANPYEADITRLAAALATAQKEHDELDGRLGEIAKEREIADLAVGVFSPAGVRAHILDTVTPFLNEKTARYLSILSDDNIEAVWSTLVKSAKGELREKFSIEVTSKTGGERFTSVSGGEKRKVRIAAALALQDLVSNRATKPIELFVGDEIDDALDGAGLERLMTILEDKARERGSVFVVSHNSLRDWIPQVMTVVKKGGQAAIVEEMA